LVPAKQLGSGEPGSEPKSGPHGEILPPEGSEGRNPNTPGAKPPAKLRRIAGRLVLNYEELHKLNQDQVQGFILATREFHQLEKSHPGMSIDPHHFTLQSESARSKVEKVIKTQLAKVATDFVAKITSKKFRKADEDDLKHLLDDDDFWTSLWIALPGDLTPELEAAVRAGMSKGMLEADVNINSSDAINSLNAIAHEFASTRAAEMVGMAYDADGKLVPNPKAQYVISDTTRDQLRTLITQAFEDNTPLPELVQDIKDAGTFGIVRAQMIANTEVSRAQAGGTYSVWEQTGIVQTVRWQNSNLPGVCEDCIENAEAGEIKFGTKFPSGSLYPPDHPNCRCVVYAGKVKRQGT